MEWKQHLSCLFINEVTNDPKEKMNWQQSFLMKYCAPQEKTKIVLEKEITDKEWLTFDINYTNKECLTFDLFMLPHSWQLFVILTDCEQFSDNCIMYTTLTLKNGTNSGLMTHVPSLARVLCTTKILARAATINIRQARLLRYRHIVISEIPNHLLPIEAWVCQSYYRNRPASSPHAYC